MWVALSLRTGMGVIRGRREVHAAGGVEAAWDRWARQHSGEARDIEARVKAMSAWLKARDMAIVGMDDARYPALLLEIPDAPLALYGWGSWPLRSAWSRALAVVGTRTCTAQGQAWAQEVASDWSGSGGRVVSGLARGIDIAAHRGTAKGQAVVVLPCGLDAIHPRIHEAEAACMVASGGLLLTERPPQTSGTMDVCGTEPHHHGAGSGDGRGAKSREGWVIDFGSMRARPKQGTLCLSPPDWQSPMVGKPKHGRRWLGRSRARSYSPLERHGGFAISVSGLAAERSPGVSPRVGWLERETGASPR